MTLFLNTQGVMTTFFNAIHLSLSATAAPWAFFAMLFVIGLYALPFKKAEQVGINGASGTDPLNMLGSTLSRLAIIVVAMLWVVMISQGAASLFGTQWMWLAGLGSAPFVLNMFDNGRQSLEKSFNEAKNMIALQLQTPSIGNSGCGDAKPSSSIADRASDIAKVIANKSSHGCFKKDFIINILAAEEKTSNGKGA